MIRMFCDVCGREVTGRALSTQPELPAVEFSTPDGKPVTVKLTLIRTVNGTANGGHVCGACLGHVLNVGVETLGEETEAAAAS